MSITQKNSKCSVNIKYDVKLKRNGCDKVKEVTIHKNIKIFLKWEICDRSKIK